MAGEFQIRRSVDLRCGVVERHFDDVALSPGNRAPRQRRHAGRVTRHRSKTRGRGQSPAAARPVERSGGVGNVVCRAVYCRRRIGYRSGPSAGKVVRPYCRHAEPIRHVGAVERVKGMPIRGAINDAVVINQASLAVQTLKPLPVPLPDPAIGYCAGANERHHPVDRPEHPCTAADIVCRREAVKIVKGTGPGKNAIGRAARGCETAPNQGRIADAAREPAVSFGECRGVAVPSFVCDGKGAIRLRRKNRGSRKQRGRGFRLVRVSCRKVGRLPPLMGEIPLNPIFNISGGDAVVNDKLSNAAIPRQVDGRCGVKAPPKGRR